MIFITVGTHEQPFDRLLKCVDKMIDDGIIKEEIICQKGYSTYEPKNYMAEKLIPYEQMQENIKKARIVITHGGPASFLDPLKYGKIPVVVPRKKEFNEHVNDHQLDIVQSFDKMGYIIGVTDVSRLGEAIQKVESFQPKKYIQNTGKIISIVQDFIDNN